jgi:hypothetical protein
MNIDVDKKKKTINNKKYMMHTAPDGITWVTIQPLLEQVMMHREESHKIPTDDLTANEKRGVDYAVLNIEAVANFLRALLVEHELETIVEKDKKDEG